MALLELAYHATEADPDESDYDIVINYSEALYQGERREEAVALLKTRNDQAPLCNQLGNLLSKEGNYSDAVAAYESGLRIAPTDIDIMMNCAAACVEADLVHRADEILSRLLEIEPTAQGYNLTGHVARIKGEYPRAEAAYREAMALDPKDQDIALNLVELQMARIMYMDARAIFTDHLHPDDGSRAEHVWEALRNATEIRLSCHGCEREWWAPVDVEPQPRLRIQGELPDETPAGKCPKCGDIYCIGCAKTTLRDSRFYCKECDVPLKLAGDHLKLVVKRYTEV